MRTNPASPQPQLLRATRRNCSSRPRYFRPYSCDTHEPNPAAADLLERNLLEIVHSPTRISNDDLEQIRRRIDAAALLFKVRVLGDELRRRNKTS